MGGHPPHLPVAPLDDLDLQPAGGDLLALANGRIARPHRRFIHDARPGGQGHAVIELHTGAQGGQFLLARDPFHLHPVGLGGLLPRLGEARLQLAIVGEQQQPLAVAIEPPCGIDAGLFDVILEGLAARLVGELAEHHVGLVQQEQFAILWGQLRFAGGCMAGCGWFGRRARGVIARRAADRETGAGRFHRIHTSDRRWQRVYHRVLRAG